MVEDGRELVGVTPGVVLGDTLSTPTRDLRVEERGVTLLLRYGFVGVAVSAATAALGGTPLVVRVVEVAASRGVRGVFAVRLLASVGFNGRCVFWLGRSMGILLGVAVCGRGGRRGERGQSWPCGVQWRGRGSSAVDVVVVTASADGRDSGSLTADAGTDWQMRSRQYTARTTYAAPRSTAGELSLLKEGTACELLGLYTGKHLSAGYESGH